MGEQQHSAASASGEAGQHRDYYVKLRARFRNWAVSRYGRHSKWAEYLLFAPDLFHLLCKLAVDPAVPVAEKAKLATAIAYFVSPLDLLPEIVLGPIGFVDDIALAAYVLDSIVNKVGEDVVRRHWVGDEDVLAVISRILTIANNMVGSGLWAKLRAMIG